MVNIQKETAILGNLDIVHDGTKTAAHIQHQCSQTHSGVGSCIAQREEEPNPIQPSIQDSWAHTIGTYHLHLKNPSATHI